MISSALTIESENIEIDGPDLLPLLDILFMLIVFLLLTANSVQLVLELDLPTDGVDQAIAIENDKPIMLYLFSGDERWKIGEHDYYQWSNVESYLRKAHQNDNSRQLIIVGDRNAPMERVLQVLAFLKREGRSAAQILMKPNTQTKE